MWCLLGIGIGIGVIANQNLEEVDIVDSDEMQKLTMESMSGGMNAKKEKRENMAVWTMEFFKEQSSASLSRYLS